MAFKRASWLRLVAAQIHFLSHIQGLVAMPMLSKANQIFFSTAMFSSSSWWIPRCSQMRYIIPQETSGSTLGSPTIWMCLVNLQRRDLDTRTTSTGIFWSDGASTLPQTPSRCLSSSPYLKGRAQPPYGGNPFRLLESVNFVGHYPKAMTICEGWNVDRRVNQELLLLTQLSLHHNTNKSHLLNLYSRFTVLWLTSWNLVITTWLMKKSLHLAKNRRQNSLEKPTTAGFSLWI